LDSEALAPNGRKLKCSHCKHVWFQDYVKIAKVKLDKLTASVLDPKKNKIFLPALVKKKNSVAFYVFAASLVCLLVFILFQEEFFVEKLGTTSINGIEVRSAEISYKGDNQIDVNASIQNNSGVGKRVPPIKILLFDENKKLLKSISIPAPPRYLKNGDRYAFYKRVPNDLKTRPETVSIVLVN
jgi:hypothetical protein